jgi:hypothetical protein
MDTLSFKVQKQHFSFYNQGLRRRQGVYRTIHRMYRTEKYTNQINNLQTA